MKFFQSAWQRDLDLDLDLDFDLISTSCKFKGLCPNNWDLMHLRKIWVGEDAGLIQDLFKDPMVFLFYRRMFLGQTLLFVFKQTRVLPIIWYSFGLSLKKRA